ncbi:MAG TPA: quinolinate synthase NadA [Actinomycetota bacterium]|nr:quinolinate synthase NadA [Actinomycetota bacterium]
MAVLERDLRYKSYADWADRVLDLADQRNAVILAHNYQVPWIQEVAHFVGDSLELSRKAAETSADIIVFCGVHFMAETAKILSPQKTVLLPDLEAGCSLASSITAEQLKEWKAEHPGAVVVSYVNTTAEVKAESDYCCTSANAPQIVRSIPEDKEILFLPDMFLGAHVERVTGRKMHIWMGECHVHAGIQPSDIKKRLAEHPEAEFHIHPECGCASQALYLVSTGDLPADRTHLLGTAGMQKRAIESKADRIIVATETGLLHGLRKANPEKEFIAANEEAICKYMKTITPERVLNSLENMVYEIHVPEATAARARLALERMISIL